MTFTTKDRAELARARQLVADLEAKETAAVTNVVSLFNCIGLQLAPGVSWIDFCRQDADAIRDALEPFDSGVRCKDEAA